MLRTEIDYIIITISPPVALQDKAIVTNSNAMIGNLNLFCKQICTIITAIYHHFHEVGTWRPFQIADLTHKESYGITEHTFVGIVGDQHPRLILMLSQQRNLLIELQTIRFLGTTP